MKSLLLFVSVSALITAGCGSSSGTEESKLNPEYAKILAELDGAAVAPSLCEDDGDNDGNDGGCYALCHLPEGNPDNLHTLYVGAGAVIAHLKQHGVGDLKDYAGECGSQEPSSDDEPGEDPVDNPVGNEGDF